MVAIDELEDQDEIDEYDNEYENSAIGSCEMQYIDNAKGLPLVTIKSMKN